MQTIPDETYEDNGDEYQRPHQHQKFPDGKGVEHDVSQCWNIGMNISTKKEKKKGQVHTYKKPTYKWDNSFCSLFEILTQ